MKRLLAVMVAVMAACGDDGGGGSLTVEGLPGALGNAYCSALVRCGAISDVASCRDLDFGVDFDPELAAAVDNGSVIFNEAEARLCIAGVGETCEEERLFDDNEHCDLVFTGTLGANAACAIGEQCLSGFCNITSCPDACCPGTCVGDARPERPRLGEACVSTEEAPCIESYCNAASGQCEAYKPTGQSCESDSDCARGFCTGVCTDYPSEGEPCIPDSESTCDSIGLYCNVMTNVCTPLALEGDTCSATTPCSPVYTCNGATCELSFRLGDTCAPERGCIDGSYCDETTLRCTAPKADGAACDSSRQCSSRDCDFDTMTCVSDPICI